MKLIEFRSKDIDKRDKIINAALDEFGENGFKKASTNNIVKRAGVSKGLLYHYFESKEVLYEYLLEFCFETVAHTLKNDMDWNETDFFQRLKTAATIKMDLTFKYPSIYDFSIKCLSGMKPEEMQKYMEKYSLDLLQKVYFENIDFSKFRDDIDVQRAMKVVMWTFDKYGESIRGQEKVDVDSVRVEIDGYIVLFKQCFYKEGGTND